MPPPGLAELPRSADRAGKRQLGPAVGRECPAILAKRHAAGGGEAGRCCQRPGIEAERACGCSKIGVRSDPDRAAIDDGAARVAVGSTQNEQPGTALGQGGCPGDRCIDRRRHRRIDADDRVGSCDHAKAATVDHIAVGTELHAFERDILA